MPKGKHLGKPKEYTIEQLQKLMRTADMAGDTVSRDILAAKIVAQGGAIATGEIPENETKLGKLERLRLDALAVNDTDSAEKIGNAIAEIERLSAIIEMAMKEGAGDIAQKAKDRIGKILAGGFDPKDDPIPDYEPMLAEPQPPVDGGMDVHGDPVSDPENAEEQITLGKLDIDGLPPVNGGMNVHVPHEKPLDLAAAVTDAAQNPSDPRTVPEVMADELIRKCRDISDRETSPEPQDAPDEPITPHEGHTLINNGNASGSANARIELKGYNLSEIPARDGGKVDIRDVRDYEKLLTQE